MSRPRIVVTGVGAVTPLGWSVPTLMESLHAGRAAAQRWREMDTRTYSKIGGQILGFSLNAYFDACPSPVRERAQQLLRSTPRPGCLAAAASYEAVTQANLATAPIASERLGHVLGGHNLNGAFIRNNVLEFEHEPEYVDPLYGLLLFDSDVLAVVSELYGVKGPTLLVGGACASSNFAIQVALDMLRVGRCDACLVTGVTSELDPVLLQGWSFLEAITLRTFNDEPARASRPFDTRREGFVPSEAAGALVLETEFSAKSRSIEPLAEVLGAAANCSATRSTRSDLSAQVRVMEGALYDAGLTPQHVDYVNAHATSTQHGDAVEAAALRLVLGDRTARVPVNATKSMLGHCLQAASVVEAIATIEQLRAGRLHPTINVDKLDRTIALDVVRGAGRPFQGRIALSNSFGFGGLNSCVVLGIYHP